ncbi:MAG: ribosome maturation factor RimP [Acidimicrobiia bacterium]|nr:ribosome maturation factor RimP [Acidimicrobiia bacterium]
MMTRTVQMSIKEQLYELVSTHLNDEHLELYDLEWTGAGRGRTLRILVDGADLDRLAEVSRTLSRRLDGEFDYSDPYRLEVSSPGLERKLSTPAHFISAVGSEISAKIRSDEGHRTVKGELVTADEVGFEVETESGTLERFDITQVTSANTVFRWERNEKPGS